MLRFAAWLARAFSSFVLTSMLRLKEAMNTLLLLAGLPLASGFTHEPVIRVEEEQEAFPMAMNTIPISNQRLVISFILHLNNRVYCNACTRPCQQPPAANRFLFQERDRCVTAHPLQ